MSSRRSRLLRNSARLGENTITDLGMERMRLRQVYMNVEAVLPEQ
jgi:hypothetical protein